MLLNAIVQFKGERRKIAHDYFFGRIHGNKACGRIQSRNVSSFSASEPMTLIYTFRIMQIFCDLDACDCHQFVHMRIVHIAFYHLRNDLFYKEFRRSVRLLPYA